MKTQDGRHRWSSLSKLAGGAGGFLRAAFVGIPLEPPPRLQFSRLERPKRCEPVRLRRVGASGGSQTLELGRTPQHWPANGLGSCRGLARLLPVRPAQVQADAACRVVANKPDAESLRRACRFRNRTRESRRPSIHGQKSVICVSNRVVPEAARSLQSVAARV